MILMNPLPEGLLLEDYFQILRDVSENHQRNILLHKVLIIEHSIYLYAEVVSKRDDLLFQDEVRPILLALVRLD
jgi:hypothetical protein